MQLDGLLALDNSRQPWFLQIPFAFLMTAPRVRSRR